jgi:hypothetical protein
MSKTTNVLTDALQLVQSSTINSIFSKALYPEAGFSIELFRKGTFVGSLRPDQKQSPAQNPLLTKNGDTCYRINLGTQIQLILGTLRTKDGYTREYSVMVDLQVVSVSEFLERYLQRSDPIHLVILGIQDYIQEYADRTSYEEMHPTNILAKAMHAFDDEPERQRAGIRVVRAYQPTLEDDADYQPIYNHLLSLTGNLNTIEDYTRTYDLTVELSVVDTQSYKNLESVGVAPFDRAEDTIDNELQNFARLNFYEDVSDVQLRKIIENAFNNLSSDVTGGLKVIRIHKLILGSDKTYKPIDQNPILIMNGEITTIEGYKRSYDFTVELQVFNYKLYRYLYYKGPAPLDRAKTVIDGKIQKYACQQFYEDLTDIQLSSLVEHAFEELSNPIAECLEILRVYRFSLGADTSYQPPDLNPLLTMNGQLTTLENYKRNYTLTVELQVISRHLYRQLKQEGNAPLEMAKVAIDGELQKFARQNFYEDFSDTQMRSTVEHAFDTLANRLTGGMEIIRAHNFSLDEDAKYLPPNLNPQLSLEGKLNTLEGYVCDYILIVELLIEDRKRYQQVIHDGANPLALIKVALDGELLKYAHQQSYSDLATIQLDAITQKAFGNISSRVTCGLEIICAHCFSLKKPAEYVSLGPQTITLNGILKTSDHRERAYEMTVILEVTDPLTYVPLVLQGGNPLAIVKVAIEGAIQEAADGKTHDGLSDVDLPQAAFNTFASSLYSTICGLKLAKAHKISLHVDERIQHAKEIIYQKDVDEIKLETQSEIQKKENKQKFELDQQNELQQSVLAELQQKREESRFFSEYRKKAAMEYYQNSSKLAQKLLNNFADGITDDLQSGVQVQEIEAKMRALNSILQPNLPLITGDSTENRFNGPQNSVQPQEPMLNAGSSGHDITQISAPSSQPKRNKRNIPEWGIHLMEIAVPADLRDLVDDQERIFQVQSIEDGLASSFFEEADLLIKINRQPVYTLTALEVALDAVQLAATIEVIVLRGERKMKLLPPPFSHPQ